MSRDPRRANATETEPARRPRWLAVLLVGLALAAGVGWWWRQSRPGWHLEGARRLVDRGRPGEAAAWLDLPERTPGTRPGALLLRARIAVEGGRPAEAVAPLQALESGGPGSPEVAFWKGRALQAVGNTPQAIAWYRAALAARPDDPEALRWLASAAYDLGDRAAVLGALRELTRLRPDDAPAWRTLGLVILEEPEGGEQEFELARQAYERTLKLDPAQPAVRLELARVLVKQGRLGEAETHLAAVRGRAREADRADLLAQVAWSRGDRAACRAAAEAGLKADPSHAGLHARLGLLEQAEGRPEEALARFDRAVAADPFESQWSYMRATALRALGRADEAAADLARSEALKADVVALAALNAEAAGRPDDPGVRVRIGRLCERLGKPELAASWYRAALACDPRSGEALEALGALGPAGPAARPAGSAGP